MENHHVSWENSLEMVIFHSDVTNYQRLDGSSGNSPDQNPEKSPFFQHGRGTQIPLPRGHEVNHPERTTGRERCV